MISWKLQQRVLKCFAHAFAFLLIQTTKDIKNMLAKRLLFLFITLKLKF